MYVIPHFPVGMIFRGDLERGKRHIKDLVRENVHYPFCNKR